ncbi:MAG: Uncharacterised protein [Formosa sp. Hel1_33_131]|nr:MAG: Uncharacterised protein [Formosa sp. Hel1_33_131]
MRYSKNTTTLLTLESIQSNMVIVTISTIISTLVGAAII